MYNINNCIPVSLEHFINRNLYGCGKYLFDNIINNNLKLLGLFILYSS